LQNDFIEVVSGYGIMIEDGFKRDLIEVLKKYNWVGYNYQRNEDIRNEYRELCEKIDSGLLNSEFKTKGEVRNFLADKFFTSIKNIEHILYTETGITISEHGNRTSKVIVIAEN
jgi:hypothetical protein